MTDRALLAVVLGLMLWLLLMIAVGAVAEALRLPATPTPVPTLARVTPSARGERPAVLVAPVVGRATATASPTATATVRSYRTVDAVSLGVFRLTSFTNWDAGMDGRGITASGERTGPGVAASDPAVVPLRSVVEIDGLGVWRVLDTGGEVRGRHLDLWAASRAEALRFGVKEARVWLRN